MLSLQALVLLQKLKLMLNLQLLVLMEQLLLLLLGSATASISAVVTTTDLTALKTSINSNAGTTGITAEFNGGDKSKVLLHSATGENISIANCLIQLAVQQLL